MTTSTEQEVDISGLDKLEVFKALYNRAQPQGMGLLHYTGTNMTDEEASEEWARHERCGHRFDYVKGRVMKVGLAGDSFSPWLYDRDNGQGAAAEVVDKLR